MQRLERPEKNWKFSAPTCMSASLGRLHACVRGGDPGTAAKHAPWFVVPADNKWFTRLVVAAAIVEMVEGLDLTYPKVDAKKKKELAAARGSLPRRPSESRWRTAKIRAPPNGSGRDGAFHRRGCKDRAQAPLAVPPCYTRANRDSDQL